MVQLHSLRDRQMTRKEGKERERGPEIERAYCYTSTYKDEKAEWINVNTIPSNEATREYSLHMHTEGKRVEAAHTPSSQCGKI